MRKTLRMTALAAALVLAVPRTRTTDVAFPYRMGNGFAGDINRAHPFQSLPGLMDATSPITRYGNAFLISSTGTYRTPLIGDVALTDIRGVLVRPFPVQQFNTSQGLGAGVPPLASQGQIIDGMYSGFVLVNVVGTPKKDDPCFVWAAANSGNHVQGGFEAVATGGSTMALSRWFFNGPPDANGVCEIYRL